MYNENATLCAGQSGAVGVKYQRLGAYVPMGVRATSKKLNVKGLVFLTLSVE
jgi:hypothetical protein